MSVEAPVEESAEEGLRPCDYCGHPVLIDSVDEYDCPACGERDEDQPEAAGGGASGPSPAGGVPETSP